MNNEEFWWLFAFGEKLHQFLGFVSVAKSFIRFYKSL